LTRAAADAVNEIAISNPFPFVSAGGLLRLELAPTGRKRVLDLQKLAELLDRHVERRTQSFDIERPRGFDARALDLLRRPFGRRQRVRATECTKSRGAHDATGRSQLKPHPNL